MTATAPATWPVASERATSERIAARLREAILAGAFAPGTWIRQADVAERYGASRLPVREALRMLESEGLTEYHPHQGARVPLLALDEVSLIYRMRENVEPLALAESMPRLDAAAIRGLFSTQDRIEELTGSAAWSGPEEVESFLRLDRELHLGSYAGCRSPTLVTTIQRLWNSTQPYRRLFVATVPAERAWVINAEHRLILDAVQRGDAHDAAGMLRSHIRRTRVALTGSPELLDGPRPTTETG